MNGLAVSVNPAHHDLAVLIRERFRLQITFAAAFGRFFPGGGCVLHRNASTFTPSPCLRT